jgi:hypothetical protein
MEASQMSPLAIALLAGIFTILIAMLSLLISMVWDVKKDLRSQKDCINSKMSVADCRYERGKIEEWIKGLEK